MSTSPSRRGVSARGCGWSRAASRNCPTTRAVTPTTATPRDGRASLASSRDTSMPPDVEAIAERVFSALADPTRRSILATLATQGPATATDLADRLPITRQAIAKQLVLLAHAAVNRQGPGAAGRRGPRDPRTRRAAAGPLPAQLRAGAGGAAVPSRVGARLGWPARCAQGPPRSRRP